jgi:hypothetical protein
MMTLFFFLTTLLMFAVTVGLGYVAFQLKASLATSEERSRSHERNYNSCAGQFSVAKTKYKELVVLHNTKNEEWKTQREKLLVEVRRLGKYRSIEDAAKVSLELRGKAESVLAAANSEAAELLSNAKISAAEEIRNAKQHAKNMQLEIDSTLNLATLESSRIVSDAKLAAKGIAGGAYDAMANSSLYEKTAKAMKNVIKGYGDEYIIPEESLLDDLAEDFSHEAAGRSLKLARMRTKQMILNGTAGACDYADTGRRNTAINFVLDAFNGKVDSILSRVKHDNAGKLTQSIRDACSLVNFNGKAFKGARIADQFLEARLDELRWAEIAQ